MISIDQRNKLIAALYRHLNISVIPIDDDGDIPARPYVVYNITRDNGSNGQDSLIQRVDPETDVLFQAYQNEKEGTLSFTIHSEKRDEAMEISYRMKEYFERIGRDIIARAGFAVIEVGTTTDRSVLLQDHYERRYGFDVRVRYLDRSEYPESSIEEIIFRN